MGPVRYRNQGCTFFVQECGANMSGARILPALIKRESRNYKKAVDLAIANVVVEILN